MGPIGSAVLTFIGYKQTDRYPNRQAKYIYRSGAIIILSIFNNLFIIVECSEEYENIKTIQGNNLFKQEIVQVSSAVTLQAVFVKEDDVKIEIKGKS